MRHKLHSFHYRRRCHSLTISGFSALARYTMSIVIALLLEEKLSICVDQDDCDLCVIWDQDSHVLPPVTRRQRGILAIITNQVPDTSPRTGSKTAESDISLVSQASCVPTGPGRQVKDTDRFPERSIPTLVLHPRNFRKAVWQTASPRRTELRASGLWALKGN